MVIPAGTSWRFTVVLVCSFLSLVKFYSFSHPHWPFIGFYGINVVCLLHSCGRNCHWKVGPHGRCWAIGVGNGSMPLWVGETGSTLIGICPHSQTVSQARMFSRPHRLNAFDLRCFLPRLGYWARTTQRMTAYSHSLKGNKSISSDLSGNVLLSAFSLLYRDLI